MTNYNLTEKKTSMYPLVRVTLSREQFIACWSRQADIIGALARDPLIREFMQDIDALDSRGGLGRICRIVAAACEGHGGILIRGTRMWMTSDINDDQIILSLYVNDGEVVYLLENC